MKNRSKLETMIKSERISRGVSFAIAAIASFVVSILANLLSAALVDYVGPIG